jgi:raffinose synthase
VDCQAGVGLSGSTLGGGASVAAKYHEALEKSVLANFAGNQCINCMCHSTENLYRWVMKAQRDALLFPAGPALVTFQVASSQYLAGLQEHALHCLETRCRSLIDRRGLFGNKLAS